jgi:hypothetical protein
MFRRPSNYFFQYKFAVYLTASVCPNHRISSYILLYFIFYITIYKYIFIILRFLLIKATLKYIFFIFNKLKIIFVKILFLARCWLCCECNDTADASGNTVTGEKFSVNLVAVELQGECQQDYIWINRFESCLV